MLIAAALESPMQFEVISSPAAGSLAFDAAAEANHRIANNLSLVSGLVRMHGLAIGKEPRMMSAHEVRLILEEVGCRLEGVARLHRLLAAAREETAVNVGDYLRNVVEEVISSLAAAGSVHLQFAVETGCSLPSEKALPLGLVVAELVTNAVKYAHPAGVAGRISLTCRKCPEGDIAIDVFDDGVGLPEGVDPMKSEQLGLRVIRSLADQLGAVLAFHSNSLGLSVTLRLPAAR
jgi:two-component sensor histidine kinase